jgi:hypothetical protein
LRVDEKELHPSYMELRTPFSPLTLFLADPHGAASLRVPAPLVLPPNTPASAAQQAWNAALTAAVQQATQAAGVEVPYSLVNALVESTRVASEHRTDGKISAWRQGPGEIRLALTDGAVRWRTIPIP